MSAYKRFEFNILIFFFFYKYEHDFTSFFSGYVYKFETNNYFWNNLN